MSGQKGYDTEELVRAYFLRAGFFALRGVPLIVSGDEITDVDLWLYERATGSSRRIQIVDIKSKQRSKAGERLFWVRGLAEVIPNCGGYWVATKDKKPSTKVLAKKLEAQLLDGDDLARLAKSKKLLFDNRISEESFQDLLKAADASRRTTSLLSAYAEARTSTLSGIGAHSLNRCLDLFAGAADVAIASHPDSEPAKASIRLAYLAAALCILNIDYISASVSFRPSDERAKTLAKSVKYGNADEYEGLHAIRTAVALTKELLPNGESISAELVSRYEEQIGNLPVDILSDFFIYKRKQQDLFELSRELEAIAYDSRTIGFDDLPALHKASVGALLDYSGVARVKLAEAVSAQHNSDASKSLLQPASVYEHQDLFGDHSTDADRKDKDIKANDTASSAKPPADQQ